jgi:hypothetical protein
MPRAWTAVNVLKGFDCNVPLTTLDALAFYRAGFHFAIRYIPRIQQSGLDLTAHELAMIYGGGLGCMAVQHVESEQSWLPTPDKGMEYGQNAGNQAAFIGLAKGSSVWLDLEGVSQATNPEIIIRYCNSWHDEVHNAGYLPGLYVGWHNGLTAKQLYTRLKFQRYWASYNLNKDQYPDPVGVCMKQGIGAAPSGTRIMIDTDLIVGDNLGRYPVLSVPDEWDPR